MGSTIRSPPLTPSLPPSHNGGYPTNPYLTFRPQFARSLPIQILFTGITLTLVSVLLIQLLFSAPSHIRIARTNFFLQVSAALSVLAWEIASLTIILNTSRVQSQRWPFMLDYVAIDFPPLNDPRTHGTWSTGGLTAWLFMNAIVSVLTQATHIHFLTLMYPSRLEARLIFILLGPLAILAALTQFAPLNGPHLDFTSDASSVRNVCNATLTILFSISLAIWGLVVNRKQAWRTDGGTAAFGVGAIILALASTAITIAYIPSRDQFEWVPGLTGAIVLWQSFLGWWWWVGAGMGISEVDEWLNRAEKRRKRRIARQARRAERKMRFLGAWNAMTGGARATSTSTPLEKMPSDMNAVPGGNNVVSDTDSLPPSSRSDDTSTKSQPPDNDYRQAGWYWPWNLIRITYRHIRNAHISAARRRAVERTEHIRESFGVDGLAAHVPGTSGWNLGSFGVREREAREAAFEMEGVERLVRRSRGSAATAAAAGMTEPEPEPEEEGEGDWESDQGARTRRREVEHSHRQAETGQTAAETHSPSPWWWGPLRRWRLQDTTEYSERH